MKEKGQGLVEFMLVLPLIIITVYFLLLPALLGFTRLVQQQIQYQSLICLAEIKSKRICQREFKGYVQHILPWAEIIRVDSNINSSQLKYTLKTHLRITWFQKKIHLKQYLEFQEKTLLKHRRDWPYYSY